MNRDTLEGENQDDDGVFWMAFFDFYKNFDAIYCCQIFGKEWNSCYIDLEWNRYDAKGGAGGGVKEATYPKNPQVFLNL